MQPKRSRFSRMIQLSRNLAGCLGCLLAAGAAPLVLRAAPSTVFLADYDSEPRLSSGRVDQEQLVARLKQLHVTAYYWLIWHAPTDWEDLKAFLPKAQAGGLEVWAYLVPPSESPPQYSTLYSEPFRLDYQRWGEEIARLSLQHTNLAGWVIDDFYGNHQLFTPAYIAQMQARAKKINPRLRFMPLMYFNEISRQFVEGYRTAVDGVVAAYPQSREEIEQAWSVLNDATLTKPGELSFPWYTASHEGDFVEISQTAVMLPGARHRLQFRERDDFTGPTAGYHFKQALVNGKVVWEQDVAGGTNQPNQVSIDLGAPDGGTNLTISFRLYDKQGVSNFGVRWIVSSLAGQGVRLQAGLDQPQLWTATQRGPFEAGFGTQLRAGQHSFHVPFIVMTAGQASEFRQRHGEPATPERMAEWVRMCLETYRDGKCDGVTTYCLDKSAGSGVFELTDKLFGSFQLPMR